MKPRKNSQIRENVKKNLVLSDAGFDYETVFYRMTWDEIEEANAALDLQQEAQERYREKLKTEQDLKRRMGRR